MKKFVMGLIVGIGIASCGAAFADEGLQKVEAYLRPTLPITMNGQPVTLDSSPVMYDGSTYLKLRDVAKLTGLGVNWNDATQTVELSNGSAAAVTEMGVNATVTSATYDPSQDVPTTLARKIIELQKTMRDLEDQTTQYGDIITKHEAEKMVNPSLEDDNNYIQAKSKLSDLQQQIKDTDTQIADLQKQQQDYYAQHQQ